MSNTITVYWACLEDEWMRAVEPSSVYRKMLKKQSVKEAGLNRCPAFKEYTENVFAIHSLYDYSFNVVGTDVFSDLYDQDFFNKHINIRSVSEKSFSFSQNFIFFTEEDGLLMSGGITPFFEDNLITERCMVIPGTFDIGLWPRPLEFAFYLKNNFDEFKIEEGTIFQYIKFHTNKRIVFKQFMINDFLFNQIEGVSKSRFYLKSSFRPLDVFYRNFKTKKRFIEEIKKNLI